MGFLSKLFGKTKLDGEALARSSNMEDYARIALLAEFTEPRPLHDPAEQHRWSRALPQPYAETIKILEQQKWLEPASSGTYRTTAAALPFVEIYRQRTEALKADVMPKVRKALEERDTSEALSLRRKYEAFFPLGSAGWTGEDPQLSHSALTRRIFFLDHWLLQGLSQETADWLKLYAAEQHLWGAYWFLPENEIPDFVQRELAHPQMPISEAVYWRAYQLALCVDNHETWQRCKGGDHVRRLKIVGPDDEYTCDYCRTHLGKEYLVARVPQLPHRECTSPRGCRCRYEPVLEALEEIHV
jgi:hypothetical protein